MSLKSWELILDETKGLTVESSEVEAFYNQYKKEFAAPEEIHAREIVVPTEAAAKDILISLCRGEILLLRPKKNPSRLALPKGAIWGL